MEPKFIQGRNGKNLLKVYEWEVHGPCLQSIQDTNQGRLGLDYTDNCDSRFKGRLTLGPQINIVDCSAAGGTAANTNSVALSEGMNATKFIYFTRGTKWAKVTASTMALASDGTETALGERATGSLYTRNAAGTEEISVFMLATAYRVITTVGNGATDTHSANDEAQVARVGNYGWPGDTILIATGQLIRQNLLTGSTTMDASAYSTRATIPGETYLATSIGLDDDNKVVLGTSNGPYFFDNDFQTFTPLIKEIANDPGNVNCRAMAPWFPLGLLIPLKKALRFLKSGRGFSIGPEVYPHNESPVQGYFTALWGSERWVYGAFYNPVDDVTYILAAHQPEPGEAFQDKVLTYYTIAKLAAGVECETLRDIETYGGRTLPTMVGGYDDDFFWFSMGRFEREIDDTSYAFNTAGGDAYLTELRADPRYDKYPVWIETVCEDLTSTETVTVALSAEGGSYETQAVLTEGEYNRIRLSQEDMFHGWRIKPKLSLATGGATVAPKVLKFRMGCWLAPKELDEAFAEGDADDAA